jgi:hypothetical protein
MVHFEVKEVTNMGLFDKLKAKFLENDSTEKDINRVDHAKQPGNVSTPKQTAFLKPKSPDRFVEAASGSREEPTPDKVEFYLEKALSDDEEHVILELSLPNVNFIQAARITRGKDRGKMTLQASMLDERTNQFVLVEKVCDEIYCRAAFRLYLEKGEVLDPDTFAPVQFM